MTIASKVISNAKGFTFNQTTTPVNPSKDDTWYNGSVPEVKIYSPEFGWLYFDSANTDAINWDSPINPGELWSWGNNSNGQLGDNTTINKSSPIQVGGLTTWKYLTTGLLISFAIKSDGTLWSLGECYFRRVRGQYHC